MKINFKKISAIASSILLTGMTMGVAAAANYPAPFVAGGAANVAIVYGTGEGVSSLDIIQAGNIQTNLQASMGAASSSSATTSISGEAYQLFTSSTKVYINDSLNQVRSVLTETEMPIVLNDDSFSGNVDASYTQTITLGTVYSTRDKNLITFAKQPTSDDDPQLALTIGTARTDPLYNASVTFNKAVNLSHADSEGEEITLFGHKFTIGSATTDTSLVLLKEAEKLSLDSDVNPSQEVTIEGKVYTVELVSSSDTSATIKVTNSEGVSESKEINEAASKKINGITIAVTTADETNLKLSASIVAGADKITLTDGSAVTIGEEDTTVDGTHIEFEPNGRTDDITKLVVTAFADDSDKDAIVAGGSYVDPVFGSFKIDLTGFNIGVDSTNREEIKIEDNGDERMAITFTDHRDELLSGFQFARNTTQKIELQYDSVGEKNISIREAEILHVGDYVVLGNEDNGYLIKVSSISNATTGYSSDAVKFTDAISGGTYETTITADGAGTVTIGGQVYDVTYAALSGVDQKNITLNAQDSTGQNMNVYNTIETSKGALIAFYKPLIINAGSWSDSASNQGLDIDIAGVKFPDGDGYTTIAVTPGERGNISIAGTMINTTGATGGVLATTATVGKLTYNFTASAINQTTLYLVDPEAKANILDPAIIIFEEKDDNSDYHAQIITLESGATSDDGIGVSDVIRTWGIDNVWEGITLASDSKKQQEMDLWGMLTTLDTSDSDQNSLVMSYPDEQVYAMLYAAEVGASLSTSGDSTTAATQLGEVLVKDTEVASVSSKNLIIVGGSCINSAAATVLGGAYCGADFTEATGAGSGQYLIQSVGDAYTTGKIALVVAGYEAADTVNAATYLRTQTVDTTAGKKYKGTSSASAALVE